MKMLAKIDPVFDVERFLDGFFGRERTSLFSRVPAIDVLDKKDRIVVKAEVPGMDKKDISVSVEGDVLTIKGETKKETEEKKEDYYYSERSYGSFYRNVALPAAVSREKVKASYKDGVLSVTLPKTEEKTKETRIEVE